MHFPNAMALNGNSLVVVSNSADGKYHYGRFVVLNLPAINGVIDSKANLEPIPWDKIVTANVMVPEGTGEINLGNSYAVTTSQERNQLIAIPLQNGKTKCEDPNEKIESCSYASVIDLPSYDPFAVAEISDTPAESTFLVSYLSSDRIDFFKLDKSKSKDALSLHKSMNTLEWVRPRVEPDKIKNQRLITKKIAVASSKTYLLLEQHAQKMQTPTKPKSAYIVAIDTADLMASNTVATPRVELWNLNDIAAIVGAQDFFIDDTKKEAFILARAPEAVFKLDLSAKTLIEVASVCNGATSMTLNPASDTIVVPCFNESRLASFSMATLHLKATSKVLGRGPSFAVIDKTTNRIFTTISNDGIVVVLDDMLNLLGHIFDKAPINRVGS